MKRLILFSTLLILASSFRIAAESLDTFLGTKGVNKSATAVLVKDLNTGRTLASHNPTAPLLPASIMKTVTIAGLLNEAGAEERFHTRVYADGKIREAALLGNLVIAGGGDPTLGANCYPESADIAEEIVESLRREGVNAVKGDLIVDTSLYCGPACPPSWAAADLNEAYGTGSHALNFRRNASGSRAVGNPESVFLSYLRSSLASAGISVEGKSRVSSDPSVGEGAALLADHTSDRYAEVMRSCMMRSDNLFAETLLRAFSLARGKEGSTSAGSGEMLEYWKRRGAPTEGVRLIDGSGLSRSNRVTAQFMGAVLEDMWENEEYASFMPLAGQEGTLSDFLKGTPLDAYVAMKTGSMKGIQCYAGYKLDEEFAPTHLIVIIMNDIGRRSEVRRAAEQMLLSLFPEP